MQAPEYNLTVLENRFWNPFTCKFAKIMKSATLRWYCFKKLLELTTTNTLPR